MSWHCLLETCSFLNQTHLPYADLSVGSVKDVRRAFHYCSDTEAGLNLTAHDLHHPLEMKPIKWHMKHCTFSAACEPTLVTARPAVPIPGPQGYNTKQASQLNRSWCLPDTDWLNTPDLQSSERWTTCSVTPASGLRTTDVESLN